MMVNVVACDNKNTEQQGTMPCPETSTWLHEDVFDCLQAKLDDADVSNLRSASKYCKHCVDSALARLKPLNLDCRLLSQRCLPGLKCLRISQLQHMYPWQLQQLSSLTQLTALHIGGPSCSHIRSKHLAWVGRLHHLRELKAFKCNKVRLRVLRHWHTLTQLEHLTLIGLAFSAADAHHLHNFLQAGAAASLQSLVLGDQQGLNFLSDEALQGLGKFLGPHMRLKVLDLSGCIEVTDAGFSHLAGLSSLETLHLSNCMKIGAGAMQQAACFRALAHLNLRGCSQLQDTHVQQLLQRLTSLKTLNVQACSSLTGSFLSTANRLVNLETLNLAYCPGLHTSNLAFLTALTALQQLDLTGGSAVSGLDVLLLLGKLKKLKALQGGHWKCRGTAASLEAFITDNTSNDSSTADQAAGQRYPLLPAQLEHLAISHLSCTESFLQAVLLSLPNTITYLDLSSCTVPGFGKGSACLKGLEGCRNLKSLNLSGSSGRLAEAALGFLSGLTALTHLQIDHIDSCPVDATADISSTCGTTAEQQQVPSSAAGTRSNSADSGSGSCCSSMRARTDNPQARISSDSSTCSSSTGSNSSTACAAGVAALMMGVSNTAGKHLNFNSRCAGSSSMASSGVAACRNLFPGATNNTTTAEEAAAVGMSCAQLHQRLQQQEQRDRCECTVQLHQQRQQQQHPLFRLGQMQQLQHLMISFSSWVDDTVLTHFSGLSSLAQVDIIACHKFSGSGFTNWCLIPGLTKLNLSGCSGLRDEGLVMLATNCTKLVELSLAGCREVTDEGVAALKTVSRLKDLNMASNRNITSRSMSALFPALHNLRQLGLSLCRSICDDALHCIAPAHRLAMVDLRGCWQVTDQGVHALLSRSPSILQLNVDSCHRLTARCCPSTFIIAGYDTFSIHNQNINSSNSSSASDSTKRPGTLTRVVMPGGSSGAIAAARIAAAAAAAKIAVAAALGSEQDELGFTGSDLIGTTVDLSMDTDAVTTRVIGDSCNTQALMEDDAPSTPRGMGVGYGSSDTSGSSSSSGSDEYLELSALHRALGTP